MAKVVGIDVERAFFAIIAVSSILGTVSGTLTGLNTDIRPAIASSSLLKAITASVVGGVGSIKGALAAGLLLGFLETIAVFFIGGGWRDAIPMVMIVTLMLIKPEAFGIEEAKT
jgi:branched-chain amino acid transport system permease protein